jgi:CheY-like chemotaxis protein
MESDHQNRLAAGMDDSVPKPFKPHDLTGAVERWSDRAD